MKGEPAGPGRPPGPSIVLVGTTLPENVGSAARAMANFGLDDLRLVAPRCEWLGERAIATATHGDEVLRSARVFDTIEAAIADRREVWATTAMHREFQKPTESPRRAAVCWTGESAIVFGPERSGLTYAELTWAHALLTIPTSVEARALNLGAAVAIVAWEWASREPSEPVGPERPDASVGALKALHSSGHPRAAPMGLQAETLQFLEARLDAVGWASEPGLRSRTLRSLRTAFLRAGFTASELTLVRGVVTVLGKKTG